MNYFRPDDLFRGLRYPRTLGEAFRDSSYADPFEPHVRPPVLVRIALFFRRRFS